MSEYPASFKISRQLDQEKINFLTERVEELLKNNNSLRLSSSQNEKDTHDIVLYFQREMEIKDEIVLRLNEELVKCQTQLKFEVEKVRKNFESELLENKNNYEHTIIELREKLAATEGDLKSLEIYRNEKDQHEGTIRRLEKEMQKQRDQLIDAMEEQERRFLEEKSQMYKDLDDQKAAFRDVALNEAKNAMGEEAKKILADNNRMFEELKFHHAEAADHQAEKANLTEKLKVAEREVTILAEKEIEYAKQAHNRTKEIKALRERVEQLEKQQAVNIERFKVKARELKMSVTKELEEATLDAAGLRRLIAIKNKELKHMKSLAATILNQRTETEQFFLESLQEVKEVLVKERKKQNKDARMTLNRLKAGTRNPDGSLTAGKNTAGFPPLVVKATNLHYMASKNVNDLELGNLSKVTIKDLSWEDKELVLRVLFAKMNDKQSNVNKAVATTYKTAGDGGPMPRPVFISEGAGAFDMDSQDYARATQFQNNFEVNYDEEAEEEDDEEDGGGGGGGYNVDNGSEGGDDYRSGPNTHGSVESFALGSSKKMGGSFRREMNSPKTGEFDNDNGGVDTFGSIDDSMHEGSHSISNYN